MSQILLSHNSTNIEVAEELLKLLSRLESLAALKTLIAKDVVTDVQVTYSYRESWDPLEHTISFPLHSDKLIEDCNICIFERVGGIIGRIKQLLEAHDIKLTEEGARRFEIAQMNLT